MLTPGRRSSALWQIVTGTPNFTPSAAVCEETASGARISTMPPCALMIWLAHSSCIGVLPSPQSAKTAARPFASAQRTMSFWNR